MSGDKNTVRPCELLIVIGSALVLTLASQIPAYLNANDLDDSELINTAQTFPIILTACVGAYVGMKRVGGQG